MPKPLAIDLFCGLGGWTEGFLSEGFDVIGFDIERHDYGTGGYPAQLVLQDVRTLHGSQFKDAAVIVASPPCQAYSYMAMPWSRAKKMAEEIRNDYWKWYELTDLFVQCFRIAMEAEVPLIVENVRGAQPWVGRSRWHYGSFYLWGDVPALMPITNARKVNIRPWSDYGKPDYKPEGFNVKAAQDFRKNSGGSWFNIAHNTESGVANNPVSVPAGLKLPGNNGPRRWEDRDVARLGDAMKGIPHAPTGHWTNPDENGSKHGGDCFDDPLWPGKAGGSKDGHKSDSRKAASAQIAVIPYPLARWIAKCFKPEGM